ncbi:aldo/keto reductase [Parapusillimonas granuli]|uniref:Aldo/keto reductase n=1 Tax=Parapusillimonas granuli TaxID=380911 RepID=A0A853FVY0_9BURK|nr:aldo/keto reductase [Parapusillimonas granuli]MBB5214819.1 2,5-diketo-D-gluconate reductase A [Parapusillimonas granuli]MEB2397933.1 aldo/keto reductase [Alcaligenaceae bacterium]NYT48773.1 aldo/keto reductase [Parapusillimonas granuli]
MPGTQRTLPFHDGRRVPQIGLGFWQVKDDEAASVLETALEIGYRSIDTAAIYGNEAGVGRGIAASGVAREELFIATKVWNDRHGHEGAKAALSESLEKLGLDYVDLYLIHWPVPQQGRFVQTWEALIQLRDEGRAKSIGVCNFNVPHLQELLDETGVLPVVNQIELHPRFQQAELRRFHAEHEIITEAWSPLGRGRLWDDATLAGIAVKHGRSVAQVILRWHVQLGHMVIPKSVTPGRMRENFAVFDFMLDEHDMAAIASLDSAEGRGGPDPEVFSGF